MKDVGDFAYDVVQQLKEVEKQLKIKDPKIPAGGVYISLGGWRDFYISQDGEMGIRQTEPGGSPVIQDIKLGPATEKNLNILLLHMGSLRIHTERMK